MESSVVVLTLPAVLNIRLHLDTQQPPIHTHTHATMASAADPVQPELEMTTVVIVGAGPAGLGCAALFKQCAIDCIVLER